MNTFRKNARWAGVFYIIATAAPILDYYFIGSLGGGAGESISNYLINVAANEKQAVIGSLIELIWAFSVVGIIVSLFPILKKHNETLALGFSGFRFIEAISTIIYSIILLLLVTLIKEYTAAGNLDTSHFQTAGTLFLAAREWIFLIGSGLVWSISALILNYLLYRSKLIPRFLSVWGLVGAVLSFVYYLPQFFGVDSIEYLYYPIALQEMVFAVWLIVKGFTSSAIASETAPKN
jgi:hypothetical protein